MIGHIPRVVTDRNLSRAALGIWSIYTLAQTSVVNALVLAQVSVRVRYFFIVAFCLNSLCASESLPPPFSGPRCSLTWARTGLICWTIWRINSDLARLGGKTSTRVFEVVIESGTSCRASASEYDF